MTTSLATKTSTLRERATAIETQGDTAYMVGDPRAEELFTTAARLYKRSGALLSDDEARCRTKAERARRDLARSSVRSGVRL